MDFTCELDDANIKIPENFVSVMPDKTLEPNTDSALLARSSFVPFSLEKARTMWEINSTPMPMLYNNQFRQHLQSQLRRALSIDTNHN